MNAIDTTTPVHTTTRTATVDRPADERTLATGPRISGLTVSDGEHVLTQDQVLDRLGLRGDEFAEGIFARCGVKRRHLELDDDFLARTLQGRTAEVEEGLMRHSVRAVDALGLDPGQIGTVVSSSLYSLGLPTLAHRLVDYYELDPTTDKYHITGVACASAVPLMRMAAGTLAQHPGRDCLVVAAESMSSHPHARRRRRSPRQDGRLRALRRRLRRRGALHRPRCRRADDPRHPGPPDRRHARRP